jgi:hypothetical protein
MVPGRTADNQLMATGCRAEIRPAGVTVPSPGVDQLTSP